MAKKAKSAAITVTKGNINPALLKNPDEAIGTDIPSERNIATNLGIIRSDTHTVVLPRYGDMEGQSFFIEGQPTAHEVRDWFRAEYVPDLVEEAEAAAIAAAEEAVKAK